MQRVGVIGDDHQNTLGIIRSLGEEGISVDLIVQRNNYNNTFTTKSKYVKRYVVCEFDKDVVEKKLLEFAIGDKSKSVVIPSCDKAALLLDAIRQDIQDFYYVGGISYQGMSLEEFMHKQNMCKAASEAGVLIPLCVAVDIREDTTRDEILECIDKHSIEFPIIVKPEASVSGNKSMIKSFINKKEFEEGFNEIVQGRYLIQEYIKIDCEYGIQGIGFGRNHSAFFPGVIKKIRQSYTSKGSTTYAVLNKGYNGLDLSSLINFVNKIEYNGIFDIEVAQSGDKFYFIEINLRNGAYGYAYTASGINLPYIYCNSLMNKEYPIDGTSIVKEAYLINEIGDISNIRAKKVSVIKWIRQCVSADVKMIWNVKDNKPFWARIMRR